MTRLVVLATLLLGAVAASAQPRPEAARIEGRVTADGAGVALATVRLVGTDLGTSADAEGHYALALPEAGTVTLAVSAVGYEPAERTLSVGPGQTVRLDVALEVREVETGAVVVTGTRTAEALEDVAIPTTVVTAARAEADGALRLGDVLQTLPGVDLTSDFGAGVQIQGLDPAYTLVLLDGEPVVGRTAGVLDLSRVSVSGIDRVEVVRGPSSSLYGSEALAGVVNLITRPPGELSGRLRARYGTFGTHAFTAEAEGGTAVAGRDWGARLVLDRYGSDGYDLDPTLSGNDAPEVSETTADLRLQGAVGPRTTLRLGARATAGDDRLVYAFTDAAGATSPIDSRSDRTDWSLHPRLQHAFGGRFAARLSGYAAGYRLDSQVLEPDAAGADSLTYDDTFDQRLLKGEAQIDALWSDRHRTVVGGGATEDALSGPRYGDEAPRAATAYAFAQHDWEPARRLALNASARLDATTDVGTHLSPKLAALVRPSDALRVRLSVGSGFKSPDFRQLYLQFNNAVGGYTIFGSARLAEGLARLDAEGRLGTVYLDPGLLGAIRPETSVALNAEVEAEPVPGLRLRAGLFRNTIRDLIDVQPVAEFTNGGPVFSYLNLARVRTEGVTAEVSAAPAALPGLAVDLGYQLLRSRDLDVLDAIEAGTVFGRTASGRDVRLGAGDYTNLFGRSTHSGTVRLAYRAAGWTVSLRSRLRSRYGIRDLDGNALANRDDEFVPSTALVDATVSRDLALPSLPGQRVRFQLGADNAFDTTRPVLVPSLAGRRVYASVDLSF